MQILLLDRKDFMDKRTIGILGLGVFGRSIINTLRKYNCDIIAVDDHQDIINHIEPILERCVVGDIKHHH